MNWFKRFKRRRLSIEEKIRQDLPLLQPMILDKYGDISNGYEFDYMTEGVDWIHVVIDENNNISYEPIEQLEEIDANDLRVKVNYDD